MKPVRDTHSEPALPVTYPYFEWEWTHYRSIFFLKKECCLEVRVRVRGSVFPLSCNFYVTNVNFTRVRYKLSSLNVKLSDRGSRLRATFHTLPLFSLRMKILRTNPRRQQLRDSVNPPLIWKHTTLISKINSTPMLKISTIKGETQHKSLDNSN